MGSGEGRVSNFELSNGIVVGSGGQVEVVTGVGNSLVSVKPFVIGSVKSQFSVLNVVPGDVVGVLSSEESINSIFVVKFGLGERVLGNSVSVGSFLESS